MKLSEAIRMGAKLRPQARGEYFTDGGSCAVGAAWEVVTGETRLPVSFPRKKVAERLGIGDPELITIIANKNDGENLTREEIADWVALNHDCEIPRKPRESDADYTKRVITEITNGAHHEASQKVAG